MLLKSAFSSFIGKTSIKVKGFFSGNVHNKIKGNRTTSTRLPLSPLTPELFMAPEQPQNDEEEPDGSSTPSSGTGKTGNAGETEESDEPPRPLKRLEEQPDSPWDRFWSFWTDCQHGSHYWLVRFLFLRLLGFVYFFAFLSLALQVLPLIGSDGLLPAGNYLEQATAHYGGSFSGFLNLPSVFWFHLSDTALLVGAWIGVGLSLIVLCGFANVPILLALWILYTSFYNIGQIWYGYGWEIMLLEAGFLSLFMVPVVNLKPFPRLPPPVPVIWGLRWMTIRVFLGAGLIKLRGDECWSLGKLSCMKFHFETQPLPNPVSPYLHRLPDPLLRFGVLWNHFTEIIVPFYAFFGKIMRNLGGVLFVLFQGALIVSGNLSFLNWLTIAISVSFFDDRFLKYILPNALVEAAEDASDRADSVSTGRKVVLLLATLLVCVFSVPVVVNMASPEQEMNMSVTSLNLVNSYGAFGSVTEKRYELVVQGTRDRNIDADTEWKTYDFPAKPDDPSEPLSVVAPYQPRLAWQLWFAAMSTPRREPWVHHLVWKLLNNDPSATKLLEHNPFPEKPPEQIRVRRYIYRFAPPNADRTWEREFRDRWFGPISRDNPWLRNRVRERWNENLPKKPENDS